MERIKAVMYGVGAMAKSYMVRFMVEKGVDVVGALSRSSNLGKDLGEVCGLGRRLGVEVSNDVDDVLSGRHADIAILTVTSYMADHYEHIERCVRNGMNVITISEEALYPWHTSPVLTAQLDRLAREHRVTVTGSGYQDIYWTNMITQLAGTSHTIDSINGTARYNVNDYGPEVARHHFVGDTEAQFREKTKGQELAPSFLRNCAEAICAHMGLTITKLTASTEPLIEKEDVYARGLDRSIPAGDLVGKCDVCNLETEQGIRIETRVMGKCYRAGELDINKWEIRGNPDIYVENHAPPTDVATCSTVVNRIPDVINGPPGFVTCEKLPILRYRAYPLHFYLR